MGKKSRRNKNKGLRNNKGLAPAVVLPRTAAAPAAATINDTICRLVDGDNSNSEKILKIELEYRHLNTFSDDPEEDAFILFAFGREHDEGSEYPGEDETCLNRAIGYYKRAKERVEDADADDRSQTQKSLKSGITKHFTSLYSRGRDMEKGICSHRWFLTNGNHYEVIAIYMRHLSHNFSQFKRFEYVIEDWRDPWI